LLREFTRERKLVELEAKAHDAELELDRTKKSQAAATQKAESEVVSAKATAEIEKQELDRLNAQLDKCKIVAKNDGIVMYVNLRRWDSQSQVRAGAQVFFQQPIFSIPDLDKMQVKVKIHESTIKRVKVGQAATIELSSLQGKILKGKVVKVGTVAAADNWASSIKEYETTVSIDNLPEDAGLRPGMSASVKIMLGSVKDAVTAPVQAVSEVHGKHVCYVVKDGKVESREVEIGESNVQFIEVKKGLAAGEAIALDARKRASAAMKASKPETSQTAAGAADAGEKDEAGETVAAGTAAPVAAEAAALKSSDSPPPAEAVTVTPEIVPSTKEEGAQEPAAAAPAVGAPAVESPSTEAPTSAANS
jgi:HlyD family secretion protein